MKQSERSIEKDTENNKTVSSIPFFDKVTTHCMKLLGDKMDQKGGNMKKGLLSKGLYPSQNRIDQTFSSTTCAK